MSSNLVLAIGLGALAMAAPQPAPLDSRAGVTIAPFGNWTKVKCTDYGVTDASLAGNLRWSAVDAKGAWSEACDAWNHDQLSPAMLAFRSRNGS